MPELSDPAVPSPSPEMASILENLQKQKLSTSRQNVINSSSSTSSVKETSSSQQVRFALSRRGKQARSVRHVVVDNNNDKIWTQAVCLHIFFLFPYRIRLSVCVCMCVSASVNVVRCLGRRFVSCSISFILVYWYASAEYETHPKFAESCMAHAYILAHSSTNKLVHVLTRMRNQ